MSEARHLFKEHTEAYQKANLSLIPDKWSSKQPAIKQWSNYCYKMPTQEEVNSWINNFSETNISLCLGESSGIIALDLDTTDQKILDLILPLLPASPVEKKGAKGFTRFFKFTGETTQILKHNGECVLEILSSNKKTTLPPSRHPNGENYTWSDKSLLDINVDDLPLLPPFLMSNIESKLKLHIPELSRDGNPLKLVSGRNNTLSQYCGQLIKEGVAVDTAIKQLVEKDRAENEVPLFTDANEMQHTEPFTNALTFYTNHLNTANSKAYRKNEEYEVPMTASAINHEHKEMVLSGKSQKVENEKKSKRGLPPASGAMALIIENILANSWIKQKELAFGASLALMSTMISRKVIFGGLSPNVYILNISPSGSGKDAPQQRIKKYLVDIGADYLLGAGDYVSDASLVDSLALKPTRLDIMDEVGGILKTITKGGADYNRKMADILCELYTSSNSKYLGRATAEGTKGSCYRPNVSILASTTPTGFSESVSKEAIEKGLLGRFLFFKGDGEAKAERLREFPELPTKALDTLRFWAGYKPEVDEGVAVGGITQQVTSLKATDDAENDLDALFLMFDDMRIKTKSTDPMLPVISRGYQQAVKVIIIHACSRVHNELPVINVEDVKFGKETILYFLDNMRDIVYNNIYEGDNDRELQKFLRIIRASENGITKRKLSQRTKSLRKRRRDELLAELIEQGEVIVGLEQRKGQQQTIIRSVK